MRSYMNLYQNSITLKKFIKEVVDELSEIQIQDLNLEYISADPITRPISFFILTEDIDIDPITFDICVKGKNLGVENLEYSVIIILKPNSTDVNKIIVNRKIIDKELLTENEDDSLLVALESNRELALKIKRPSYSLTK